MTEWMVR